ncbi:MAG TPA: site-2 protease family protein [Pyrinomonadaceae bacterium]|nr:site-2 protease family protein [Pyrinomonadaceae bacterium]
MNAQIKLFRIFGIQIGLHYSWLLIALLVVLSLAGQFAETNPSWSTAIVWGLSVLTALLFFASIVVHELSHAAVAKARGLPVRSITLFALGGVAQIEKEASDAKTEFWMAIAGPITSLLIGFVCLGIATTIGWTPTGKHPSPLTAMLGWLGIINIALAVFNMVPGFPLDGGRVLRAIVWWIAGDAARATRIATLVGQFIGFAFIILGLVRFFGGAGFGGLWLSFIGWFLLDAARSSYAQSETIERLHGVHVRDVMTKDFPVVEASISLQTFVDDYLLRSGRRFFIVEEDGRLLGLITPHELKDVDRQRWSQITVRDVMIPLTKLYAVKPSTSLTEVLEIMGREDINQLPVMSNDHLDGIVSRWHILRLLQTRIELKV